MFTMQSVLIFIATTVSDANRILKLNLLYYTYRAKEFHLYAMKMNEIVLNNLT